MATTVAANAFIGKTKKPSERELATALGNAKTTWDALVAELTQECGLEGEWNSYSTKAGWSLRMKRGKRNIIYLGPFMGGFRVAFVLGDKAVKAALASGLPADTVKLIKGAKRYAEGAAVRIKSVSTDDMGVIRRLVAIKLEH